MFRCVKTTDLSLMFTSAQDEDHEVTINIRQDTDSVEPGHMEDTHVTPEPEQAETGSGPAEQSELNADENITKESAADDNAPHDSADEPAPTESNEDV